jgi:hypothetical protein
MSLFEREFGLFRLTNSRESSQGMPSLNSPGGQGRCPRQRGSRLQQPLPRSPQSEGGSIINSQEDTVSFIDQLRIFEVRDHAVVLDRDLATIYGVVTKQFNRAVRRNTTGFPADFATDEEFENSRFQIGTSSSHGGRRYCPWAFTEHHGIMAAT